MKQTINHLALPMLIDISKPSIVVYLYLLQRFDTIKQIPVNKMLKVDILNNSKLTSIGTINNAIAELVECGLLLKDETFRGVYIINPIYVLNPF